MPEKYVDGVQVEEGGKLSAHDILAQHVTNVSPVTAKAIARALQEHEDSQALQEENERLRQELSIAHEGLGSMEWNEAAWKDFLDAGKLRDELARVSLERDKWKREAEEARPSKNDLIEALNSVTDLRYAIELLETFARMATTAAARLEQVQVVPPKESWRPPSSNPPAPALTRASTRPSARSSSHPPKVETHTNGT
jgi:post-segregation antitoxin (ccd killing protein)